VRIKDEIEYIPVYEDYSESEDDSDFSFDLVERKKDLSYSFDDEEESN
jgi:hypothetical protein